MQLPDLKPVLDAVTQALPAALAVVLGAIVVKFILNRGLDLLADRTRLTRSDLAPSRKLINWAVLGLTVVALLGVFGFNLTGLWAMVSTVLAMIAIGFVAVWSVLSNISCTFILLIFRPFAVGDQVAFPGEPIDGRVVDLNFLYTTLEAPDGTLLQIPNNIFFQKVVQRKPGTKAGAISLVEQLGRDTPAADV